LKIAVTGPRGRLARELIEHHGCAPLEVDVADYDALRVELDRVAPDCVIHAASFTDVDRAEAESNAAIRSNVRASGNLRIAFQGYLVYLSTAYVFDGEQKKPYREDDDPRPINSYGWSKWGGEQGIQTIGMEFPNKQLVVRTMSLYGSLMGRPDFVTSVTRQLRQGDPFYLPDNLISNPTYYPHLAIGLLAAIKQQLYGVLNIVGRDAVSRYLWGIEIARVAKLNSKLIKPMPKYEPVGALRPHNAALDTSAARKLKIPIFTLRQGLEDLKRASR
jgi:dTDP-4-dehydrorhamnose reductase